MQVITQETKQVTIDLISLQLPFNRQNRQSSAICFELGLFENDNLIASTIIIYDDNFKRIVKDSGGNIIYETEEYYENEPVLDQDNNTVWIDGVQQFQPVQKFRDVPKKIGEREFWEQNFGAAIWGACENTLLQLKQVVLALKSQGFDNISAISKIQDFIYLNNQ